MQTGSDLPQVAHGSEVLHVQVIASVGDDDLRASLGQGVDDIPSQKASAAKDCCSDTADLQAKPQRLDCWLHDSKCWLEETLHKLLAAQQKMHSYAT